jgi:SAM-dependent methyltransferase
MDPSRKSLEPFLNAHRIAFSPLTFQAARIALSRGLLREVSATKSTGARAEDVAVATGVTRYAARVLLEGCLALDLVAVVDEATDGLRFRLTPSGRVFLRDPLVAVNLNFVHDVCFQGAFDLERSLEEGRPAGLAALGPWGTIYEGLSALPPRTQKSWFDLDHGYSDGAFPLVLPQVLSTKPRTLLDVGGNTGRWAVLATQADPDLQITILDHPGQLEKALANAAANGVGERVRGIPVDLLDPTVVFPTGFDVVWMSQFLDCFPETDIVRLLERGREALAPGGRLYILESFWDEQTNEVGRNIVASLSLYFSCIANGTSRMYHSDDFRDCVRKAGLRLTEERRFEKHTLFVCEA